MSNNSNYDEDHGHGTHVAGIVACLDNTVGYIGVAPEAHLYGVKVLNSGGSGTMTNIAKGIDWCRTNGMKVINMSLGSMLGSTTLSNACRNAYNAGIVVVAAAGNSCNSADIGDNVGYPARYTTVIAVAATNPNDVRAYFSRTGLTVEIATPGLATPGTWIGSSYRTQAIQPDNRRSARRLSVPIPASQPPYFIHLSCIVMTTVFGILGSSIHIPPPGTPGRPPDGRRDNKREVYRVRKLLTLIVVFSLALALGQGLAPAQSAGFIDVLIGFKGLPEPAVVSAVGGEVTHTFSIVPAVAATVPQGAVRALQNHPLVAYVEHDGICTTMAQTVPWGVAKINAPAVHATGNKGAAIKVGIIDTGIQTNHPDLRTYGGYNYVSNNTNYNDDNGHGTHVAGTVACLGNDIGYIGVAPESYLYGVKVLSASGSGTWTNVARGIDWCRANGMKVINMSLGGSAGSTTLSNACANAYNAGIVVVAAAGNSGNSSGTGDNVGYPARYSSVIAVAATDSSDQRASFSSTGPALEIAAPGVSIPSTWIGSSYRSASGTSMASPHVAGVAALVRYRYPSWTPLQVRDRMNATALDLGNPGRDTWYGYGRVRADLAAQ